MVAPGRLTEPRALRVIITILVAIAAVLVFTVGIGNNPARDEPVVLSPDGAPTQALADRAWRICTAAGADSACLIYVLERTRDPAEMPALARQYRLLLSR